MKSAFLLVILAGCAFAQSSVSWVKYTAPGSCSDTASPPCYWPAGSAGFSWLPPASGGNGAWVYANRQAQTGTMSVVNGTTAATYVSGDRPNPSTWGIAAGDTATINSVSKTIVAGSVTTSGFTMTVAWAGTTGTYAYTAGGNGLTMATDAYVYSALTHTFPQAPIGNLTLSNLSGNLEADSPTLDAKGNAMSHVLPADRQPTPCLSYDSSRNAIWNTCGVNGAKTFNCNTSAGTTGCSTSFNSGSNWVNGVNSYGVQFVNTTWKLDLASNNWTGLTSTHHPVNGSIAAASVFDYDDQILVEGGYDGGANFRTALYCPTDTNPIPGTLTTAQTNGGCVRTGGVDDWAVNITTTCPTCTGSAMPLLNLPGMVYAHSANLVVIFGGGVGAGVNSTFYTYAPTTKVYTKITDASCSSVSMVVIGGNAAIPGLVYIPATGNVLFHQYASTAGSTKDWIFNPVAGTCSQIETVGNGPNETGDGGASWGTTLSYDGATNRVIAWPQSGNVIWEGSLANPLSVPLSIQEALIPGTSTAQTTGITRTNEPFCMGVPLAQSAGIADTTQLGLTGSAAGQFRILGTWPNGVAKWVKVCGIEPSLTAGAVDSSTITLTNSGSGNFGGSALAVDNTPDSNHIQITTGSATFTVKKANFNGIDTAVVRATTIMSTSSAATRGMVIMGPSPTATYPANATCGTGGGQSPCTTAYTSANDSSSTCTIEENGPVLAVLKCNGTYYDSASHPYMHFTVRETFYLNRSSVKFTSIIRDADYDTAHTPSNDCNYSSGCTGRTFNVTAKGTASAELRLDNALSGTLSYTFATVASTSTGTASGTDSAYFYEGQMVYMATNNGTDSPAQTCNVGSSCAGYYTADTGWNVVKNASSVTSGTTSQTPVGWADISDASGNGMLIGYNQTSAIWPKSLEFNGGGTDVRWGIIPSENGAPTAGPGNGTFYRYICWPCWDVTDAWVEFHAGALSSPANDFLSFQLPLLARESTTYINSTSVFPYPIVPLASEQSYYLNTLCGWNGTSCAGTNTTLTVNKFCVGGLLAGTCYDNTDRGILGGTFNGTAYAGINNLVTMDRFNSWTDAGAYNQTEFLWSDIIKFLQGGMTGRWTRAYQWYKYSYGATTWPHSDGGNTAGTDATVNGFFWNSRPYSGTSQPELDSTGFPVSANCTNSQAANATQHGFTFTNFINYGSCGTGDNLHSHFDGIFDLYNLTGDETIKDEISSYRSYYTNPHTQQAGGISAGFKIARAIGIFLRSASRFSDYLASIGQSSDAALALTSAQNSYVAYVHPDPCLSGFPTGCTPPNPFIDSNSDPVGISRTRGMPTGSRVSGGFCPENYGNNQNRIDQPFETGIELEGLLQIARSAGSTWTYYQETVDLAFGAAQGQMYEGFQDDGSGNWVGSDARYNGFRYEIPLDRANLCNTNTAHGTGTYTTADGTNLVLATGPSATVFWAVPASGTDLASTSGTTNPCIVTSASHSFTSGEVGYQLQIYSGTNWLPQYYTIASVSGGAATLDRACATTASVSSATWTEGLYGTGATQSGAFFSSAGYAGGGGSQISGFTDATHIAVGTAGSVEASPIAFGLNQTDGATTIQNISGVLYDDYSLPNAQQTTWPLFFSLYGIRNDTADWTRQLKVQLQRVASAGSGGWPADFGTYQSNFLIYDINLGAQPALTDVTITSVTNNGDGTQTIAYTPPAGSSAPRLKYDTTRTVQANLTASNTGALLGYDNLANQTFTNSPATNINWFAATDATSNIDSWEGGTAATVIVTTGQNSLSSANFSLKAMEPLGCSITTASFPAGTATQIYSQTATEVGCSASTWTVASGSLPSWASLNSSTGVISGTASGTGTATFTLSYSTATSGSLSITTNAAPSITTSSPLPAGTVSSAYSQTLAATGGTLPLIWSVQSGTVPTGTSLSGSGVLSGTPTTVTGSPFSFVALVTDANLITNTKTFTVTINSGVTPTGSFFH